MGQSKYYYFQSINQKHTIMRKKSIKKQMLVCSLLAFLLMGCHKPEPEPEAFQKYIGLWDFTTQMSVVEYDDSVSPVDSTLLVEDSIINFRGSVSIVDGKNRLLIEFLQNELIECLFERLTATLWKMDSGHDPYFTDPNSPLGGFLDDAHLYMNFSKIETQGNIHTHYSYQITGVKKE